MRGAAPIADEVLRVRAAFPDIRFTVEDQIAEGDKVVIRLLATATHQGEFMGHAATGKAIQRHGLVMFRLEQGKIVESWRHWDDHFLEQIVLRVSIHFCWSEPGLGVRARFLRRVGLQ